MMVSGLRHVVHVDVDTCKLRKLLEEVSRVIHRTKDVTQRMLVATHGRLNRNQDLVRHVAADDLSALAHNFREIHNHPLVVQQCVVLIIVVEPSGVHHATKQVGLSDLGSCHETTKLIIGGNDGIEQQYQTTTVAEVGADAANNQHRRALLDSGGATAHLRSFGGKHPVNAPLYRTQHRSSYPLLSLIKRVVALLDTQNNLSSASVALEGLFLSRVTYVVVSRQTNLATSISISCNGKHSGQVRPLLRRTQSILCNLVELSRPDVRRVITMHNLPMHAITCDSFGRICVQDDTQAVIDVGQHISDVIGRQARNGNTGGAVDGHSGLGRRRGRAMGVEEHRIGHACTVVLPDQDERITVINHRMVCRHILDDQTLVNPSFLLVNVLANDVGNYADPTGVRGHHITTKSHSHGGLVAHTSEVKLLLLTARCLLLGFLLLLLVLLLVAVHLIDEVAGGHFAFPNK